MRAVTLKDAKARLNELVDAAARGEQVVLMRGSRLVAAIVPVSERDVELAPHLTDVQAERLWHQLAEEHSRGRTISFGTAEAAAEYLARAPKAGRRRGAKTNRRG